MNIIGLGFIVQWTVATIGGVLLAVSVSVLVNASMLCNIGAILPGGVLGFVQWLGLKRYLKSASWWIPTCAIAWNASLLIGWAAGTVYLDVTNLSFLPYFPLRNFSFLGLVSFTAMALFYTITGLVILWLRVKHFGRQTTRR